MFLRFLLLLLMFDNVLAQQSLTDARTMGSAYSTIASPQDAGVPFNIASLIYQHKSFIEASITNKYSIKDLSAFSVSSSLKLNPNNSFLIGISKSGTNTFSERFVQAAISKKLTTKFSAGILLKYYEWQINDSRYSDSHSIIPELALLLNALPYINFGVSIRNPVRSRMNAIENKPLPAEIQSGISAIISNKIIFSISAESTTERATSIHTGLEYKYAKVCTIRAGYTSYPISQSFGCEFSLSDYYLAISIASHQQLGFSSAVSLTFQL